ncbi:putative S-adenosyl-L-methionine-dependent methyltransferase [Helianthus anomalus]
MITTSSAITTTAGRNRITTTFYHHIFTKPAAYFLIILLSYYLGYLSALSKNPSYNPHHHYTIINITTDIDHYNFQTHCADPVPPELVRQTILNRIFNGSSPYQDFPQAHIKPLLRHKWIKGWGSTGLVFKNLINKVQPKTIIEIGTFLGASAIHMAELTHQLGLQTQILCIDDFRGWPGLPNRFQDIKVINGDTMLYQFMQNVVSVNASESVVLLPFSTGWALVKLCEWGVFGDLIEVDAGHDFHSTWSDINRAYKLLRPGGILFGHDYFTVTDNRGVRRAVNMFSRVNGFRVKADGQHWVLDSI